MAGQKIPAGSGLIVALLLSVVATAGAAELDTIAQRALPCAACHGEAGRATNDGYYPRIAGKPAGYLHHQLVNFAEGRRHNPQMTYMVQRQDDAFLRELAEYFSAQDLPYPPPQAPQASGERLALGERLVRAGDAARGLPSCQGCHGERLTGVAPDVPGLVGLPYDYLVGQFGAWREGHRKALAPDCMAQIAQRLSPEDIGAVAAWLASQPVPDDAHPAAGSGSGLPMRCGSVTAEVSP
jgi:cytochrome c553